MIDEIAFGMRSVLAFQKPVATAVKGWWINQPGSRKTVKTTKDRAFARSVNRQEIVDGAQELGAPLDEHIDFCVKAMQARAEELGLKGSASLP